IDINRGAGGSAPRFLYTDASGTYLGGVWGGQSGTLLRMNPNATQVTRVADVDDHGTGDANPEEWVRWGDELVCSAQDESGRRVLWLTDGSRLNTRKLQFNANSSGDQHPWFVFRDELFVTNGTNRVYRIKRNTLGYFDLPAGREARVCWLSGDTVFIDAYDSTSTELYAWKSGTTTSLLLTSSGFYTLGPGAALPDGRTVFRATDTSGEELWISDGTAAGTSRLADLNPGPNSSSPFDMCSVGNKVVFSAYPGTVSRQLFATDGTTSGTVQLPPTKSTGTSQPLHLVAHRGQCYFTADDDAGRAIFRSDGTATGTVKIVATPASPIQLRPVGSRHVYFRMYDPPRGLQYFRCDVVTKSLTLIELGSTLPDDVANVRNRPFGALDDRVFTAGRVTYNGVGDGVEPWVIENDATSVVREPACGSATQQPRLLATDPVIGTTQSISHADVAVNSVGILMLGMPGIGTLSGCTVHLDPWAPLYTIDAWLAPTPTHTSTLAIPNDTGLKGLRYMLQGYYTPTSAPAGFDLSNGVLNIVGN
ncbi:MAG: hypothetical protein KDC87_00505, partial [Planctomycetes bacterium]|nr:hypothetical protein [Planctomycetota bacterium]